MPFVEIAHEHTRPSQSCRRPDKFSKKPELPPSLARSEAEVTVEDVKSHVAHRQINAEAATRLSPPPAQIAAQRVHNRQTSEHGVAVRAVLLLLLGLSHDEVHAEPRGQIRRLICS